MVLCARYAISVSERSKNMWPGPQITIILLSSPLLLSAREGTWELADLFADLYLPVPTSLVHVVPRQRRRKP